MLFLAEELPISDETQRKGGYTGDGE